MRVAEYLNITPEEVSNKKHNIWIGVSLGNAYFTKEHIKAYIKWALENTKEKVLIVIPDALHAVNLEVFDKRSPSRALAKAIKIGNQKRSEVEAVMSDFSEEERSMVDIIHWTDILQDEEYLHNLDIIKEEFKTNNVFKDFILDIVITGRPDRAERISKMTSEEMERLADYVLYELPSFVNGVHGHDPHIVYTVLPYPGLNDLDYLTVGLCNRTMFPELAEKLKLNNKVGILEAYAD